MRDFTLTPRLRLLADWVPPGARLADIGTDHAYLPVWLRLHGRAASAIACDLREGPLARARETGRAWGADGIDYRLGDGLAVVSPEEADTIVIAGMGGENIAAILARAPWAADGRHTLLLQPQSRAEVLRAFLAENGYAIRREALVKDRGTIYPVMEAAGRTFFRIPWETGTSLRRSSGCRRRWRGSTAPAAGRKKETRCGKSSPRCCL